MHQSFDAQKLIAEARDSAAQHTDQVHRLAHEVGYLRSLLRDACGAAQGDTPGGNWCELEYEGIRVQVELDANGDHGFYLRGEDAINVLSMDCMEHLIEQAAPIFVRRRIEDDKDRCFELAQERLSA
jgi:hypothetical protein